MVNDVVNNDDDMMVRSDSESDQEGHPQSMARSQPSRATTATNAGPPIPTREELTAAMTIMQNFLFNEKQQGLANDRREERRTRRRLNEPPSAEMSRPERELLPLTGTHLTSRWTESTWDTQKRAQQQPDWFARPSPTPTALQSESTTRNTRIRSSVLSRLRPSVHSRLRPSIHTRLGVGESSRSGERPEVSSRERRRDRRHDRTPSPHRTPERSNHRTSANEGIRARLGKRIMTPTSSPFSDELIMEEIPKVRLPAHLTYSGITDPRDHVISYEQQMFLSPYSEACWCKYFPTTLTGVAGEWFRSLPKGSIKSWRKLKKRFCTQFVSNNRPERTTAELTSIQQERDESLREFMARFMKESTNIPNLQPDVAIFALKHALQEGKFRDELSMKNPSRIADVLQMADAFIRTEEFNKAAARLKGSSDPRDTKNTQSKPEGSSRKGKEKVGAREMSPKKDGRRGELQPKYTNYTPLALPRKEIFSLNRNDEKWKLPGKLKSNPARRNKNKWCEFHDDFGHHTEECNSLKDNIEDLVRRGYLKQYLLDRREEKEKAASGKQHEQPQKRVYEATGHKKNDILVVFGGQKSGQASKKHLRALSHRVNFSAVGDNQPHPPNMTFTADDCFGVQYKHDDPLVISMDLNNHNVHRVLVDGGSAVNIIFRNCFEQLILEEPEEALTKVSYPLIGFNGSAAIPRGKITLPVTVGEGQAAKTLRDEFLVMDCDSVYNVIMGRTMIHKMQAVPSTYHQLMIYVSDAGFAERIRGDQEVARRTCHTAVRKPKLEDGPEEEKGAKGEESEAKRRRASTSSLSPAEVDARPETLSPEPDQEMEDIFLEDNSDRSVRIGKGLSSGLRIDLIRLLRDHKDIFAWSAADMPGINPKLICHKLDVNAEARPIKQKKRNYSSEKNKAIAEEVKKLQEAGFIEPCMYPKWLANVVMVKKANGSWRMCVDFTDLNRACPKDCYPLPRIDQLVDSTSGHALLSFMDAFSGYHQVFMHPDDRAKTAFITSAGVFNYKMMPFGLKNAGATYQRLVDHVFADQKGRNVEVYVDDSIVKSIKEEDHVKDLAETFGNLRKYSMKLNPKKCVFGVKSGKFLGFMVSERGIDANPDKVQAALDLPEPKTKRDVQRLTGRLAALTRFISKASDKGAPFFKALKPKNLPGGEAEPVKKKGVPRKMDPELIWEQEQKEAFQQLRAHLAQLPTLARPKEGETLYLYVAVSPGTVSAVLLREEEKKQQPIYFTSRTLTGAETRYPLIEKVAYAVVVAARKLRPYFDSHQITVLTDQPLEKVLDKIERSGRLAAWAFELSEFGIKYQPRTAIKAQALADFLAECSYQEMLDDTKSTWEVFTDGSSTVNGSGAGVVLIPPTGKSIEYALKFGFKATNNEAEYEAAIAGIELCLSLEAEHVRLKTDSQLVANQIRGEYEAKWPSMTAYLAKIKSLTSKLRSFEVILIPRGQNAQADALSKLASSTLIDLNRSVHVEVHQERSIDLLPTTVCSLRTEPSWMDAVVAYKERGELPEDKLQARKLKRFNRWFIISAEGELMRKSFSAPLLKCVGPTDADYILREIHLGICGNHIGGRTLAHKALRAGYWWPTMVSEAKQMARKCEKCQKFAPAIHQPAQALQSTLYPLPFAQWGLDIIGPFPSATNQKKWLIVGVDYFSKWIEAEAVSSITEPQVRKFIWQNIITRFGIPRLMVFDHGKQFDNTPLQKWCKQFGIHLAYSAVCHPQSNGQAEAANKLILNALKKRVEDDKNKWLEELPGTLWSLRTTEKEATGQTPFHLVYGSEAVIPVEIGTESLRIQAYNRYDGLQGESNNQLLSEALDLLDEARNDARTLNAAYLQRVNKHYNRRVNARPLKVGDLVLRNAASVQKGRIHGKLSATWEGPYIIHSEKRPGTYMLKQLDGTILKNHWNTDVLKKYFV
ncbi:uncharacterized protein [Spinacia oleracea]|uniref:Uncharacterized protein n=1 Tax=Spinacia oleracea TaxID=3562 RepID=A0ABM3RMR8_SPIOL|nr:uncharacterized protein LOC110792594 [Spinacia oleracea]XP_056696909.1 uncharacterized protein LOC110792594 [Spinacia oleracea]XP_056696910.1 uncharacterized protein LOC110792594 [Spinacia oleracea]XP_056696911.1 uncharacterized protein LOC110792594 [Spinacia oleracea]